MPTPGGPSQGGSLGLVLGCDVGLVAPEASFTPYDSIVGFSPDGGWTACCRTSSAPNGRSITAEQAVAWGLASRVVPAERIRDEALAVAQDLAAKKPGSLRHTKRLLSLAYGDLAGRLETERAHFVEQIVTEEARQGITAFLERRSL